MKKITSLLIFCFVACVAWAGPISRQQAEKIAKSYLQDQRSTRAGGQAGQLTLAYECMPKSGRSLSTSNPLFYVFDQENQGGFVVIAGDDRMRSVLGYVDEGEFDLKTQNGGFRWWLSALEETMTDVVESPEKATKYTPLFQESDVQPYVLPLVKALWGQFAPYNNLCPVDNNHGKAARSLVGCTAVAIAQILSKWQYPLKGEGVVDYVSPTHNDHIHLDMSSLTFDWDNMLPSYEGVETTNAQKTAVAELMYACGAAMHMSYCSEASGVFCSADLLEKHLGIDPACNELTRVFYTRQEWDHIIKKELSEGRPVLYNGFNSYAGHAFVCDGYNVDGLFHINWGWTGSMNGYFALAELNTSAEYAGAPTGDASHYNCDQTITCGIQPKRAGNVDIEDLLYFNTFATTTLTAPRTNVKVKINYVNSDGNGFSGQVGLGVFDSNDEFKGLIGDPANFKFESHSYLDEVSFKGAVPEDLENGIYTLYPVCKSGDHAFVKMLGRKGSPHIPYLLMNLSGHIAKLSAPEGISSQLEVLGIKILTEQRYAGCPVDFEITLKNNGGLYYGPLTFSNNEEGHHTILYDNNYVIESGEEKTIRIRFESPEGINKVTVDLWQYSDDNDDSFRNGCDKSLMGSFSYDQIVPAPGVPKFSIRQMELSNSNLYLGETLKMKLTLKNDGGFYGDEIHCFVFPENGGSGIISAKRVCMLDKGETKTYIFSLPLSSLPVGNYFIQVFYFNDDYQYQIMSGNKYNFSISDHSKFSISNTEGYGVWAVEHAFVVPENCECGVVTVADRSMLKVDYRYQAGDVVPASTPVVVKAAKRGSYPYEVVLSDLVAPKDNLLLTTTNENGFTDAGEGDYAYYGFDRDSSRKNYGFYLQREDGSAFKLKPHEAYLALPVGTGLLEGYPLNRAVTGIEQIAADAILTDSTEIYTLGGVRVAGPVKNLPKGIYIAGGKKIIVK